MPNYFQTIMGNQITLQIEVKQQGAGFISLLMLFPKA